MALSTSGSPQYIEGKALCGEIALKKKQGEDACMDGDSWSLVKRTRDWCSNSSSNFLPVLSCTASKYITSVDARHLGASLSKQ